jgi:hypothetical protein
MKKVLTFLVVFALILSVSFIVFCDTVLLKNGKTHQGKIIKEDEEKIALKKDIMTVIFYKDDIESIQRFYPEKGSIMPEGKKFDITDILNKKD